MRADGCKIFQIGYTNGAFVLTVMTQGQERAESEKKKRGLQRSEAYITFNSCIRRCTF
jgi:hypothetical protein